MGAHAPTIHVIYPTIFVGDVNHMKNKLDWFDDNWNWNVRPTRVLYELLLSLTYRWPVRVKIVCSYKWGVLYFHYVHGAEPQWNAGTNASVTDAVKG